MWRADRANSVPKETQPCADSAGQAQAEADEADAVGSAPTVTCVTTASPSTASSSRTASGSEIVSTEAIGAVLRVGSGDLDSDQGDRIDLAVGADPFADRGQVGGVELGADPLAGPFGRRRGGRPENAHIQVHSAVTCIVQATYQPALAPCDDRSQTDAAPEHLPRPGLQRRRHPRGRRRALDPPRRALGDARLAPLRGAPRRARHRHQCPRPASRAWSTRGPRAPRLQEHPPRHEYRLTE